MFNTRLKRLREWRNMTQKELGLALNYSQQTIHKWEAGDTSPDPDLLQKIAAILNVPVGVLLGENMVEESPAPYDTAEDFMHRMTQSKTFMSLFEVDPTLDQETLDTLSHQLFQMTVVLITPYKQK
jgi:transcriptional regulator with XRE-family HTH domain